MTLVPTYRFRDVERSIINALEEFDLDNQYPREVTAYLYYITVMFAGNYADELASDAINNFTMRRLLMYRGTPADKIRGDWLLADHSKLLTDPVSAGLLMFGDLLVNVAARENYDRAPVVIRDFTQTMLFTTCMVKVILPIVTDYIEFAVSYCASTDRNMMAAYKARFSPGEKERQREASKDFGRYILCFFAIMLGAPLLIALLALPFLGSNQTSERDQSVSDRVVTTVPRTTAVPRVTAKPLLIYNGKQIITPEFNGVCPFTVVADSYTNYYIYLDYVRVPVSAEGRTRKSTANYPYENDVAFIVMAGKTVSVDVPIGVYKLYYATGESFYGTKELFGSTTSCYEADKLLTFHYDSGYYNGHTITLKSTYNGNFDTDEISEKVFPTR